MIKNVFVLAGLVIFAIAAAPVQADTGITFDLPISYEFDDGSNGPDSIEGIKAGFIFPFNMGLGAEYYSLKFNGGAEVNFTFIDIFYILPIPFVNIGLGVGGGEVGLNSGSYSESGTATQVFFSLGVPIMGLFDIHVGYHMVDAQINDGAISIPLSGTMTSVGGSLTF